MKYNTRRLGNVFDLNSYMSVPNMELFQTKIFILLDQILLDKICKSYKLFKIQGTGCYNINITFISSSTDGLLHFVKFEFRQVSSFF